MTKKQIRELLAKTTDLTDDQIRRVADVLDDNHLLNIATDE